MVLLDHIVKTALDENKEVPSVCYCKYEMTTVVKYMLMSDGAIQKYNKDIHGIPAYLLSDSVDIDNHDMAEKLSLEVASDKPANYKQFIKRIGESGDVGGLKIAMPLFSLEELNMIKPTEKNTSTANPSNSVISNEEATFRYDVLGGSARNFVSMAEENCDIMPEVEETMLWVFGEKCKESYAESWNNIATILSYKLQISVANEHFDVANSTFVHLFVSEDGKGRNIWASRFIEILIGFVVDKMDKNLLTVLKGLIGGAGMGCAYESIGHKKLTRSESKYPLIALNKANQKKNRTVDSSMKYNYPVHLFRTIADIGLLENEEYGLPVTCNFPLVDAVIQPDTLINFTTANTHKGAVDKLLDIRKQLHEKNFKITYSWSTIYQYFFQLFLLQLNQDVIVAFAIIQ